MASLSLAGCDEPPDAPPESTSTATTGGAPTVGEWTKSPPPTSDSLLLTLHQRSIDFAKHLNAVSDPMRGSLTEGSSRDYQLVLRSDRCYRIVGAGGPDVVDLDLLLFDEYGVQVRQDDSTDSTPVLGAPEYVCPSWPTAYRLEVRIFEGEGDYAVRVFETDPV